MSPAPPEQSGEAPGPVSALLGVGSNLGERRLAIARALELLGKEAGIRVVAVSRLIETEPVGGPPQGRYLNGAAEVHTALDPHRLLEALHRVEEALGRVRAVRHGPRTIDLDILLYGDRILLDRHLEIPHPLMLQRAFVLEPLAEIVPERIHPVTGWTILQHWRRLEAKGAAGAPGAAPGGTP